MDNGAGYNSHPTDCEKFVQCRYDADGQLYGVIQQCAFGTYWNMDSLTCLLYNQTACGQDKCAGLPDLTVLEAQRNCRGYWRCEGGKAVAKCCPKGYIFEIAQGCVNDTDEDCNDRCFSDELEEEEEIVCDKREIPGNENGYEQFVDGFGYVPMPCGLGTVYNQEKCKCADHREVHQAKGRKCKKEIHLPFNWHAKDMSGNNFHIENENVYVSNGYANFNGNSRLIIPRFTNLEHSSTIVIKVRYRSSNVAPAVERAIVSNSDCGNLPSIMISEDINNIYFGVGTTSTPYEYTQIPREQTPFGPAMFQEVTYTFHDGVLTGTNGVNTTSINVPGYLRNVRCALHIGDADNLASFIGTIYRISVYLCRPKNP